MSGDELEIFLDQYLEDHSIRDLMEVVTSCIENKIEEVQNEN